MHAHIQEKNACSLFLVLVYAIYDYIEYFFVKN